MVIKIELVRGISQVIKQMSTTLYDNLAESFGMKRTTEIAAAAASWLRKNKQIPSNTRHRAFQRRLTAVQQARVGHAWGWRLNQTGCYYKCAVCDAKHERRLRGVDSLLELNDRIAHDYEASNGECIHEACVVCEEAEIAKMHLDLDRFERAIVNEVMARRVVWLTCQYELDRRNIPEQLIWPSTQQIVEGYTVAPSDIPKVRQVEERYKLAAKDLDNVKMELNIIESLIGFDPMPDLEVFVEAADQEGERLAYREYNTNRH
jgi:hypothetical protein